MLPGFKVRHILFACIRMYIPTWNPLNNVRSFMLLLKRRTLISALRLGSSALFRFVGRRMGCSCQQFLSEDMKYVSALYTVTVSKWDFLSWIPDNCFGCCHLLSITFKSITPYAKVKRSPWQLCIPKLNKVEQNRHCFAFIVFLVFFFFFLLDKCSLDTNMDRKYLVQNFFFSSFVCHGNLPFFIFLFY